MSVYPPTPTMSMMNGGVDRKRAKRPPNVGSKVNFNFENCKYFLMNRKLPQIKEKVRKFFENTKS